MRSGRVRAGGTILLGLEDEFLDIKQHGTLIQYFVRQENKIVDKF